MNEIIFASTALTLMVLWLLNWITGKVFICLFVILVVVMVAYLWMVRRWKG